MARALLWLRTTKESYLMKTIDITALQAVAGGTAKKPPTAACHAAPWRYARGQGFNWKELVRDLGKEQATLEVCDT
jgi:hypothetical protein